ncbi:MAG TPA: peptidoglycan-binding domain-containing protein [Chthoniobacterales bacterium]
MFSRFLCCLICLITSVAWGDEQVRQVQEELRRRNLYFGDVDGQATPDLANALKRYQARKGFAVTGAIDQETATSLNVRTFAAASRPALPDVPVLKSDTARELPEPQRVALQQQAEENPDAIPSPAPPAESPPPAQNDITPDRINRLVEEYLRDGESNEVQPQVKYFAYPVEYFDHGTVGPAFVEKDVANYVKRWPERKYVLTEPVSFVASGDAGDVIVEFPIAFSVRNKNHVATGRTKNTWTVRPEGGDLKIVAIREQRLRE